jgi:ubiquinone/menaquinone biosynthesis C-methylase UbiE
MVTTQKRFALPKMEGAMARWYARQRGSQTQIEAYRAQAALFTGNLPDGADILEVAPGPGYLAIEIARTGRFHVAGLDISHSFVRIARENARRAGVDVDFRNGSAESLPFPADSVDLIVCQAAFKNFGRPVTALNEMHRVLRPGATAVIQDLTRDASRADIAGEVRRMRLRGANAAFTRWTLAGLRLRAARPERFRRFATESAFRTCAVSTDGITMEVRLTKRSTP